MVFKDDDDEEQKGEYEEVMKQNYPNVQRIIHSLDKDIKVCSNCEEQMFINFIQNYD